MNGSLRICARTQNFQVKSSRSSFVNLLERFWCHKINLLMFTSVRPVHKVTLFGFAGEGSLPAGRIEVKLRFCLRRISLPTHPMRLNVCGSLADSIPNVDVWPFVAIRMPFGMIRMCVIRMYGIQAGLQTSR